MQPKIPDYYTITEAAAALALSRPGAEKAAQREGWEFIEVGNVHLFRVEDVREYRDHRQRTKLVKALGWRGRGLYRCDDIDLSCSECDDFAVMWPPPPLIADRHLCINGHLEKLGLPI
jgi:hypothetical protein